MAGNVNANFFRKEAACVSSGELKAKIAQADDFVLLDVRNPREFEAGHLPGPKLLPLTNLRARMGDFDPGKETVTYCRQGFRAYIAYRILKNNGFSRVPYHSGGLFSWLHGTPVD